VIVIVGLAVACTGGGGRLDSASTTTTSPAPEWLRHRVSGLSVASQGPKHGTGWIAPFASRVDAVEAVSGDRVENTANPPVSVVVVRGDFVAQRGVRNGVSTHGKQLTLVIPRAGDRAMTDLGIGRVTPLPAGSERFSF
jgi:hypothetical protein